MTDHSMADSIYIEPLIPETVKRIIEKEKPDSLLSTLGGQTGLTLSMELAKSGFLKEHNVRLLGANPETIDKAEDRATCAMPKQWRAMLNVWRRNSAKFSAASREIGRASCRERV